MKSKFPTGLVVVLAIIVAIGAYVAYSTPQNNNPVSPTNTSTQAAAANSNYTYTAMTSRQVVQTCTSDMATQFHIHAHLEIMANKQFVTVPAEIGINVTTDCMRPIHTHDDSGIIHIESPVQKDFMLSDFFYVWEKTFNKDQILDYKVDADHGLKMYVDGKEVRDFENLILVDTQDIFIDYYNLKDGPDPLPAFYQWDGGKTSNQQKPLA